MSPLGRALLVIAVTLPCLDGCAGAGPRMAGRVSKLELGDEPARYIVAGVDNDDAMPVGHAGSSPKGYDGLASYGPGSRAVERLRGIERDYGLKEITAWPIAPLHMHCAVLELHQSGDRAAVLTALSGDPRVRIAQPLQNFATETAIYDDPYVGLQRGFQRMEVSDAHAWSRGEGVKIAIIDTGADIGHPDLRGVVMQAANFVDADSQQFRRDRHGTELAGIIAAVANNRQGIVGIAPGARLAIFKACWQLSSDTDAARCNSFTLARALTAALDAHVQIVNLSLSGPADPLLRQLIVEGLHRGIVFIGAARSGPAADAGAPADDGDFLRIAGVIAVATDGMPAGAAGAPLHAPGREILTLLPGGRYDFASGTSLATAHATGAAALLLGRRPRLGPAEVYRLLHDTTTPAGEAGGGDSIDACAALASLLGQGSCPNGRSSENRVAMHQ